VDSPHRFLHLSATSQKEFPTAVNTTDDALLSALERRLAAALGGSTRFGPLGLRWPAAARGRSGDTVSFRTNDVGGYGPVPLDPTLDVRVVIARFARIPDFARTDELKQARLIPCADEAREELLTGPIPMDRWITFETSIDRHVYRLCEGRWRELRDDCAHTA
jgi:uncharacterized protein (TIGR04141 family)